MWEDETEVFWYAGKLGQNMRNLRDGGIESLQGTWRQGVGETNSSLLGLFKSTSPSRALTALPEPSLLAWASLL